MHSFNRLLLFTSSYFAVVVCVCFTRGSSKIALYYPSVDETNKNCKCVNLCKLLMTMKVADR